MTAVAALVDANIVGADDLGAGSMVPPDGKGMMTRMGCVGDQLPWARATAGMASRLAATARREIIWVMQQAPGAERPVLHSVRGASSCPSATSLLRSVIAGPRAM
jgi:hypothetical protein